MYERSAGGVIPTNSQYGGQGGLQDATVGGACMYGYVCIHTRTCMCVNVSRIVVRWLCQYHVLSRFMTWFRVDDARWMWHFQNDSNKDIVCIPHPWEIPSGIRQQPLSDKTTKLPFEVLAGVLYWLPGPDPGRFPQTVTGGDQGGILSTLKTWSGTGCLLLWLDLIF
ncbi:hypothetical protein V8C35DRAFT_298495 [Trichoderma chlorosporum]